MNTGAARPTPPLAELLDRLGALTRSAGSDLAAGSDDSPLARLAAEFFANSWTACRDGLLARSSRVRVVPLSLPVPTRFQLTLDIPFKRKPPGAARVLLDSGPLEGRIFYRPEPFAIDHGPSIAVAIDSPDFFHPNFSRRHGLLCCGNLPPGPYPLEQLIENFLYPILSYQVRRPSDPADIEAARYFALDPNAMEGLEPAKPLY